MIAVLIVGLVLVALLALGVVAAFNGLVRARVRTHEAWSQIDVELTRRHDLVPNLVATVRGYAAHERGTFEAVTAARAGAVTAQAGGDPGAIGAAEGTLTRSLHSLLAVAEAYPQLRAAEGFQQLQAELTATEDKLEFARRYFNGSARDYDIALQTLPRSIIAGPLGFTPVAFFETDPGARAVPVVDLTGPVVTAGTGDTGPGVADPVVVADRAAATRPTGPPSGPATP